MFQLILSQAFLLVYAVAAAWIGAKHVLFHAQNGEKAEILQTSDALLMPIIGSGVLFGLYLLIRYAPKDILNLLISFYLALISLVSLSALIKHYMRPNILTGLFCVGVTASYMIYENWIVNDMLAFALAIVAIETVPLNNFVTSFVMMTGLFFYDIFWVFGTEVMITVATSINGPIKVLFPQTVFGEHKKMSILGLGDIIVPSLFIGQVLTFSRLYAKRGNVYFHVAIAAYAVSLISTMAVLNIFKTAQPALLFIVPWLLLTFCVTVICYRDVHMVLSFDLSKAQGSMSEDASLTRSFAHNNTPSLQNTADSKKNTKSKHVKKNEAKKMSDETADTTSGSFVHDLMLFVCNLFGLRLEKEDQTRKIRVPKARRGAKNAALPDTAHPQLEETA